MRWKYFLLSFVFLFVTTLPAMASEGFPKQHPKVFDGDQDEIEFWQTFNDPYEATRDHGLAALQALANKSGVVTFVDDPDISEEELAKLPAGQRAEALEKERGLSEILYGTRVLFLQERLGKSFLWGKGLAFHPGFSAETASFYLGEANPHVRKDLDKWSEYVFAQSVDPSAMATTYRTDQFLAKALDASFERTRKEILAKLHGWTLDGKDSEVDDELAKDLDTLTTEFFEHVVAEFPEGAYMKNIFELKTGDHGSLITTKVSRKGWGKEYLKDIRLAKSNLKKEKKVVGIETDDFQEEVADRSHLGTTFLNTLIVNPKNGLVQRAMDVAFTPLGKVNEMRVDFLDGEAVRFVPRYFYEYLPDEGAKAKAYVNQFFKQAQAKGSEFAYLCGGADVMFQKDGTMKFTEFNAGADSGFMNPWRDPIDTATYFSAVLGKPTPVLAALEKAYAGGLKEEQSFIYHYKRFFTALGTADDVLPETRNILLAWFRDRHLDQWRADSRTWSGIVHRQSAVKTAKELRELLEKYTGTEKNEEGKVVPKMANMIMKSGLLYVCRGYEEEAPCQYQYP